VENKVTIEGVVKWEPRIFEAKSAEQSDIASVALEHTHQKSDKTSVFTVKQFDNGDGSLASKIRDGEIIEGTQLKATGYLRESNWKNQQDEWVSQVQVFAFEFEVTGDLSEEPAAVGASDDDDIPF
jgi:hypothetical protein